MICFTCNAAELQHNQATDSWRCPECKRWCAKEVIAEIELLRATGDLCWDLVNHLYEREHETYTHCGIETSAVGQKQAEVRLDEVRRALRLVIKSPSTAKKYLQRRTADKQREGEDE